MVASGSRTMIAGSLSSCIAGFRQSCRFSLRVLIRRMSVENPLWGAPRIHGELLKLGFEIAQSGVAKIHVQTTRATQPGMANLLA